jgi:hypothetical protein
MNPKLHTLAFEAEPDALPEGAGDIDTDTQPDTEAEPTGQAVDYDAPEFREAVSLAARDELGAFLQQAMAAEQDGGEEYEIDPLGDPAEYQQNLSQMFERMIDQRMQAIMPTVQEFQNRQSQEQIGTMLEKIPAATQAAEMLPEEQRAGVPKVIEYMANGYLPDTEARYGPGERAVETALRMAADEFHNQLKVAHKAGYEARNAELGRLAGAREPVASGQTVEATGIRDEPADEREATDLWLARNGRAD